MQKRLIAVTYIFLCVGVVFLTGCFGTIGSRSCELDDTYFFGKPVYGAVGYLPVGVSGEWCGTSEINGRMMMAPFVIVSVPMDFILDTVFLPVDLVAWGLGYEKDNNELRGRYNREESRRRKEEARQHRMEEERKMGVRYGQENIGESINP